MIMPHTTKIPMCNATLSPMIPLPNHLTRTDGCVSPLSNQRIIGAF
jgi:hypothetical protein